jgi:hypothetical protein
MVKEKASMWENIYMGTSPNNIGYAHSQETKKINKEKIVKVIWIDVIILFFF